MDPANAIGAVPRPSRPLRAIRNRCDRRVTRHVREPYQSPPSTDPSAQTVISGPAAAREPSLLGERGQGDLDGAERDRRAARPTRGEGPRCRGTPSAPARVRSTSASGRTPATAGAVAKPVAATSRSRRTGTCPTAGVEAVASPAAISGPDDEHQLELDGVEGVGALDPLLRYQLRPERAHRGGDGRDRGALQSAAMADQQRRPAPGERSPPSRPVEHQRGGHAADQDHAAPPDPVGEPAEERGGQRDGERLRGRARRPISP